MVGPIDVKVKRKGSASVGYWVQYVTLTFDLTQVMTLTLYVAFVFPIYVRKYRK